MSWQSSENPIFRNQFSESIFYNKYKHEGCETWEALASTCVDSVCFGLISKDEANTLKKYIREMKFIPGGRYLYYAGRKNKFWNNCYLFRSEEDSREDWATLSWKAESALMTGGGIGNDYSRYRGRGSKLSRTGGQSSGPVAKMEMVNEIGRHVMQGGARRSAIYASLNWKHPDVFEFLYAKDWDDRGVSGTDGRSIGDLKRANFNYPAPLDMTNISVNYDDRWLRDPLSPIFIANVTNALRTGEPGFSFNFGDKENETLRNACTEVVSEDDSDVCNLGSINFSRITSIDELSEVVNLATLFLLCGTIGADVPFKKVKRIRQKNRRLGLGIMGLHEWLIVRGYRYEVVPELRDWLEIYKENTRNSASSFSRKLSISSPVATRAIAPTGTIGILAGTTTGIEPIYAVAYQRRYLKDFKNWHYQYVIDSSAQQLINRGIDPDTIESAVDLAEDPERRIKFQYDVQKYVDQAISSTINLPHYGSELNNPDTVRPFASLLSKYAHGLRGFTVYPDGARGGQPINRVEYDEAKSKIGQEYEVVVHDICDVTGKGGTCGV